MEGDLDLFVCDLDIEWECDCEEGEGGKKCCAGGLRFISTGSDSDSDSDCDSDCSSGIGIVCGEENEDD